MTSPKLAVNPCAITVAVFDGSRQPMAAGQQVLFTVRNGNQKQVYRDFQQASRLALTDLPFFDNSGDNYTVIASADGYEQAGFFPVKAIPGVPVEADLMLLRGDGTFNFSQAGWERLGRERADMAELLAAGAASAVAARNRYEDLLERKAPVLACYFNLITAMSQILLPTGTPVNYLKELIWEDMTQARFFAWADPEIVNQVRLAAAQGVFAREPAAEKFHPGATESFKQVQFGEANVQLTFHENDRRMVDGVNWVKVEPDVDYFKDPVAHTLLEVLPNALKRGQMTDPRQVYVLRWIAGRHAQGPEFDPPYTIS
ncbi:MAG: hypothetical protein EXQ52_11075 [Bryobacterales bacterium]|nr:hypothetical protein [Bryobacterales bacterium]